MRARKGFESFVVTGILLLLVWGLVQAATSHYQAQRDAIFARCSDERKQAGLDREALRARYPTPELTLCRMTRVAPGGTTEVVARGNFQQGTRFLFDNDKIEVLKEGLVVRGKESEYRATIKVAERLEPDLASLVSFQPMTCRSTYCRAVYIAGKYEWDFTADNGWRIKLKPLREDFNKEVPEVLYCAEFYRGGEVKPFEVRETQFGVQDHEAYAANIREQACGASSSSADTQGELAKLRERMMNPAKLSEKEYEQVMQRYQELLMKSATEQQAKVAQLQDPKYIQEMDRQRKEFGCRTINFWLKAGAVEGNILCGEKVGKPGSWGRLELKGTMKYLGPVSPEAPASRGADPGKREPWPSASVTGLISPSPIAICGRGFAGR